MSAQQLINHHQAVRSLLLHLAACFSSLPIPSQQVLWLAAGIGTNRAVSPSSVARTLHISPAAERVVEGRAITQLRAAGRRGCHAAVVPSPSAVVTGTGISLPAALIATAAQTVGGQPASHSSHVATRRHRAASSHRAAASHHGAGRGRALLAAAIPSATHGSMLIVWALLALAAVGFCWIVVADRRRGIGWSGGIAASRIAALRPGALRRPRRRALERSVSTEEIIAPAGGWAPPLAHDEAAAVAEINAPEGGWAPPVAHTEPAPVEQITAPEGGWAPPIHGLTPPVAAATRPGLTSGTRRTGARLRGLRAQTPTRLGVAGGAIAAILAVAAKPQRSIGRRHR